MTWNVPSAGKRPRVVLADDHRMLREALSRMLETDCEIVGAAADGRALLAIVAELQPDVAVVDVSMPLLNGIDAARQLTQKFPDLKVVFLTVNEDPDIAAEAFRAGASGFLLKNSAGSELLQAIHEAMQGRTYVTPLAARGVMESLLHPSHAEPHRHEVSPRQREVLQLLAEGRTMKEIAQILEITPRTVAFHKYAMMKQLGIESSAELVRYAIRHGLAES